MTILDFFKIRFLGFYKPELKSEDIFVLRRVRASEDIVGGRKDPSRSSYLKTKQLSQITRGQEQ